MKLSHQPKKNCLKVYKIIDNTSSISIALKVIRICHLINSLFATSLSSLSVNSSLEYNPKPK